MYYLLELPKQSPQSGWINLLHIIFCLPGGLKSCVEVLAGRASSEGEGRRTLTSPLALTYKWSNLCVYVCFYVHSFSSGKDDSHIGLYFSPLSQRFLVNIISKFSHILRCLGLGHQHTDFEGGVVL